MRRVQAVVFGFVPYQTRVAASAEIEHENSSRVLPFYRRLVLVPVVEEISLIQKEAGGPMISLLAPQAALLVAAVVVVRLLLHSLLAFPLTPSRFHFVYPLEHDLPPHATQIGPFAFVPLLLSAVSLQPLRVFSALLQLGLLPWLPSLFAQLDVHVLVRP